VSASSRPPLRIERIVGPLGAVISLPGSKSLTNRALVCAALASGTSELQGALIADDTMAMIDGLRAMGVDIDVDRTTVVVDGTAGLIAATAATVDARLSGTTSRFLMAVAGLGVGPTIIDGAAPLRSRPMLDGISGLRSAGLTVTDTDGSLPVAVSGHTAWTPELVVSASASSQFLSGLLLAAPALDDGLAISVEGELRSHPYVEMTVAVMRAFGAEVATNPSGGWTIAPGGYRSTSYLIEPDASAASYFFAAAAVCGGWVRVEGLGSESLQGDLRFVDVLESMGAEVLRSESSVEVRGNGVLHGVVVDMADISDTAPTLAAVAPCAASPTTATGIGFIRAKETDRIGSVLAELRRAGVSADELDDGWTISPGAVSPAVIETYDDHRIAMSFTVLGLRFGGLQIADPAVVDKTFPEFFEVVEQMRHDSLMGASTSDVGGAGVVAIDGPAGSGKSTVARLVADQLGKGYLDTGAMYRAVTWKALDSDLDLADHEELGRLAERSVIELGLGGLVRVDGIDVTSAIRSAAVNEAVSVVAAVSSVRTVMRERQRQWMAGHGGGVVEGRDIGTVVFPDAELKVFLTASPLARAERRATERGQLAVSEADPDTMPSERALSERVEIERVEIERVAEELLRRDQLDSNRADSPLRSAEDSLVLDTTDLSINQVVDAITSAVADRQSMRRAEADGDVGA